MNIFIAILVILFSTVSRLVAQTGNITTIAGNHTAGYSGNGAAATAASLNDPFGVAADAAGNVYVADVVNHCIRKITPSGIITTIAGTGIQGFSGDGGPGTAAQLHGPCGVAVDASGNVYVADDFNNRIRKITPSGVISTFAGTGTPDYTGDGGQATAAAINNPNAVAVDASGNIYISDYVRCVIRKVNTAGIISTVAGNGTVGYSGDGGPATAAQMNQAWGIAIDRSGAIYFSDQYNYRIRKINTAGIMTTIGGNGTSGAIGENVPATTAEFFQPYGVAVDDAGNVYVCDNGNERVRKIDTTGIITTFAGNGIVGYSGDGGLPTAAELYAPSGVAINSSGNFYIADDGNNCIRKIAGTVTTSVNKVTALNAGIRVFPNPNYGIFTLELPMLKTNATIILLDLSGNIVEKIESKNLLTELNLKALPASTYLLKVVIGETCYIEKIIVW